VATYADRYDAALLYPLPRAAQRALIGVTDRPIFLGADLWTAYELSWLNARGKPQVALGRFTVPSESTHLVESKSLKLYLNSFNNTVFADIDAVRQTLQKDLSEAVWRGGVVKSSVGVQLMSPEQYAKEKIAEMDGLSLDRLDLDCSHYQPAPELLSTASYWAHIGHRWRAAHAHHARCGAADLCFGSRSGCLPQPRHAHAVRCRFSGLAAIELALGPTSRRAIRNLIGRAGWQ